MNKLLPLFSGVNRVDNINNLELMLLEHDSATSSPDLNEMKFQGFYMSSPTWISIP